MLVIVVVVLVSTLVSALTAVAICVCVGVVVGTVVAVIVFVGCCRWCDHVGMIRSDPGCGGVCVSCCCGRGKGCLCV